MKIFLFLTALLVLSAPVMAQQNMADLVYGSAEQINDIDVESNRSHVTAVQHELRARGYKISVDGIWGPQSRKVLKSFQRKQGLDITGNLNAETLIALGLSQI